MLVDPKSGEPTRIGRREEDGKMVRYSKKSGEIIKHNQPRLKVKYQEEVKKALDGEIPIQSVMQIPRIEKISINQVLVLLLRTKS